jgi:hypothetical protein
MTQAQHTPGPWHIDGDTGNIFGIAPHDNGEVVVCTLKGDDDPDMQGANARLIAASVDLLEAAQKALNFIQSLPYEPSMAASTRAQDALVAAITKARGQA